jgi:hypothetical protein
VITTLSPAASVILDVVTEHRTGTSFVEIETALAIAGHETNGHLGIEDPRYPNLFIWAGVNQEFMDALNELLRVKAVHWRATSLLVYLADGKMLSLPIAKSVPGPGGFKKPRWIPVVVNVGPVPD